MLTMVWSGVGLCPHSGIGGHDSLLAETIHGVIIRHSSGLHMSKATLGAHEFKLPLTQVLAHRILYPTLVAG